MGLRAIRGQDLEVEVLVLANGPARALPLDGDRVVRVPWEGHGATRQRGVELATGEYIFMTVDDAIPLGAGFLRTMVEALEAGGFDAVFARQVPWPDGDAVTAARLRRWTPAGVAPRCVDRLDNVAALYRRRSLLRDPFPPVPIAEDLSWSRGRRIGYVPTAPVIHGHRRRPGPLLERTRATHAQHALLGDRATVPSTAAMLAATPGLMGQALRHGPKELACAGAELLGQWLGARDAARARGGSPAA